MQKAVAIIPARFESSRFPGKPLARLKGKTIVQHVYDHVSDAKEVASVYVATDDQRIYDEVIRFGGRAFLTSPAHLCGTERVAEAAKDMECDIVINVQCDEPFIRSDMIDETVNLLRSDKNASISTLAVRIKSRDELLSPHVVKVVMDSRGYAMYFSRSPIPYYRDVWASYEDIDYVTRRTEMFKHIGIYGFRKDILMNYAAMGRNRLEEIEQLEQLRALASGIKIKVGETEFDTIGIDTIDDLRKAEQWQNISS